MSFILLLVMVYGQPSIGFQNTAERLGAISLPMGLKNTDK